MRVAKAQAELNAAASFIFLLIQLGLLAGVATQVETESGLNVSAIFFLIYVSLHILVRHLTLVKKEFEYDRKSN